MIIIIYYFTLLLSLLLLICFYYRISICISILLFMLQLSRRPLGGAVVVLNSLRARISCAPYLVQPVCTTALFGTRPSVMTSHCAARVQDQRTSDPELRADLPPPYTSPAHSEHRMGM